jgi:hypothetical protein
MSVRFGNLPDSSLVVRNIRPNHRVLVASGAYLSDRGTLHVCRFSPAPVPGT